MSFKQLLTRLYEQAGGWSAEQFLEPQSVTTRQVEGLRSEGRVRHHTLVIDEPKDFAGTDLAPNPAEATLAALGASLEVTCRVFADYHGIAVRSVATSVKGNLDLRGFLDLAPEVRSGFQGVDVTIHIDSDASDAEIERLIRQVQRSCPVLDVIRSPTAVGIRVERAR